MAVFILIGSVALGVWNAAVHTPWNEPPSRPATAAEPRIPHTAVSPYSANTFLSQEVEPWKREKTVEMLSLAGISWIKEGFPWSEIEPSEGSFWDPEFQQDSWQKYDEIVDLAEEYGIRIIARLDHTPEWARPEGSGFHTPPSDPAVFGRFVEAFVERYSGRIQYIQIWNEPNLAREWGGEIDPNGYFELLREAYVGAKSADPEVVVLSAPMAMTNEHSERAIPEFDYWEALYDLGAGDYFDVLTATGYGIDQAPDEEPSHDVINLRRIELLRDVLEDYGDSEKPIWLTEYGWNAAPDSIPEDELEWGSVSVEEQAEWTAGGIRWMSENWEWFGVSSIWYFRQVGMIPPDAPEYYFAMVDLEFTPRQVYLTVQNDALERRTALPGTYAPLEAPVQQFGTWSRFNDPAARFGESIRSDSAGSEIRIEFTGTDLSIETSQHASSAGRAYISLNGSPAQASLYDVDDEGRTYLALDDLAEANDPVTLVERYGTDRPQETNELRIVLDTDSSMSVSSITVEHNRSYGLFGLLAAVSGAGLLLSGLLFRR